MGEQGAKGVGTDGLSDRERQIARAYASGDSYQRIAERLVLAPSTVRTHLATIYKKLGVSSKIELHQLLDQRDATAVTTTDQAAMVAELSLNLEESIRRERALGEVLRIISRAQGDLAQVISAVLGYALELCDAQFGILFEYGSKTGFEAKFTRGIPAAFDDWLTRQGAFNVGPRTGLGRLVKTHEVVNIVDVRAEDVYRRGDPLRDATAELGGARSFTAIPMLAGDRLIGAFTIYRKRVRPFDERALETARMFADQSVIAIENARLVSEVRRGSRDRVGT
ncbi:MAG: LuxR C-terminal-related transcriptional regulator [Pseudomonadota bacterium]